MSSVRKCGFVYATVAVIAISIFLPTSCKPTSPWAQTKNSSEAPVQPGQSRGVHDLSLDESRGGHTLKRHVGRTDAELEQRLHEDRNISAASTYTDRQTAESVVGETINRDEDKIARWLLRNRHPNLVLDYDGRESIGRTLRRDDQQSQPCSHAIIVLRWDAPNGYHVLTSYPECR